MAPKLLHVTYDVEVTPNGVAWFAASSSHFKEDDAKTEMLRIKKEDMKSFGIKAVRLVRVTKEIVG